GSGELAAATGLDDHVVLDADAAPAGQVDAGLDGDDHALLEHGVAARVEAGVLVRLQAQAVADAVDEPVAQAAGPDDRPPRFIALAHGGARTPRRHAGVVGGQHQRVDLQLAGVGVADHDCARGVGPVAVVRGAEVEQDQVAGLDAPAARAQVR